MEQFSSILNLCYECTKIGNRYQSHVKIYSLELINRIFWNICTYNGIYQTIHLNATLMKSYIFGFLLLSGVHLTAHSQNPEFNGQVIDDQVSIGYGVATGDVDGDGKIDILLADKKEIVWYKNPGKKSVKWAKYIIAKDLTASDHVCIAARDIDGDGKVEVAVGAQWNPGETQDLAKSGAVYYLDAPKDRTQLWKPVKLYHEVTIHRMKWVKAAGQNYKLFVLPLHGQGNVNGQGTPVNFIAFDVPNKKNGIWSYDLVSTDMHMTHNFFPVESKNGDLSVLVGGKEGIKSFKYNGNGWASPSPWPISGQGVGELALGKLKGGATFTTTIEPMHGTALVIYVANKRIVLNDKMKDGHALAAADLMKQGQDQIVMGWRNPGDAGETGVKIYVATDESGLEWKEFSVDPLLKMACEDLTLADLDGDGKLDIIASGRASKNVIVYWNATKSK
jgi:hypothetical protein